MNDQVRHKGAMNDDPRLRPYFQSDDERRRMTQAMWLVARIIPQIMAPLIEITCPEM